MIRFILPLIAISLGGLTAARIQAAPRRDGQLRIEVVDVKTGQPLPARMHLKNTRGRAVKLKLPGAAEFADHFYIDGPIDLPLRRGQYTFELDAGPEFRPQTGHFEIDRHADDTKRIEVTRFANLAEEGWWGGDLDVKRREQDLPLVLRAEGLQNVGISESGLFVSGASRGVLAPGRGGGPPGSRQSSIARTPYAWELPVWLARYELAAIQLIHHHALRDGVVDDEDAGRPRDTSQFPGRSGNGRWSECVYYHVLNCGLRIPPVAGSGSGTNNNPVGTNRVYAYCGDTFSKDAWWEAVRAGRVFVTNGPLLRTKVEGQAPGYVFYLEHDGSLSLEIGLELATREPIEYLQIIKNGQSEAEVRLADWKNRKGRLPVLTFDDSGWFLVRAVTANQRTYQFASSGPYYVERGGRPRVSRRSVQFFLDWLAAADTHAREAAGLDDAARQSLLADHETARRFFDELLSKANAD